MVIYADLPSFENTCYQLFKYRANGWQVEAEECCYREPQP
jgi:hypothetical protein